MQAGTIDEGFYQYYCQNQSNHLSNMSNTPSGTVAFSSGNNEFDMGGAIDQSQ
jgi:hypothetical protein